MIFSLTFALVLAVDQLSKALIRVFLPAGKSVNLIGRYLALRQIRNPGAVFGLFANSNIYLLTLFSITLVIFMTIYFLRKKERPRSLDISLGLVCGGAVGNLIDRLVFGKVIDFVDFNFWPVFNMADVAIVLGIALLIFYFLRYDFGSKPVEKGGEDAS